MKNIRDKTALARIMRREQTEAERLLWQRLRGRQLEDIKFRRQQPLGPFIVDFISFERQLVIEIDGGHHNSQEIVERDIDRTRWLEQHGYSVMRFWNNEVLANIEDVIEAIREESIKESPSPNPLPSRERQSESSLPSRERVRVRGIFWIFRLNSISTVNNGCGEGRKIPIWL